MNYFYVMFHFKSDEIWFEEHFDSGQNEICAVNFCYRL